MPTYFFINFCIKIYYAITACTTYTKCWLIEKKSDFFDFSLYFNYKCLLSICLALFVVNNACKSFRRAKSVACLVLYSRKLFLITLPLLFKKWVGYLNPLHFVDVIRTSHGIALTVTKLIDFYSQCIFTFLFATVFNWNEPERQLIAKLTLPHRKKIRVIFPLFWFTKFIMVSRQRALWAWQKYQTDGIFKLLSINFSKYVHCDMRF